MNPRSARDLVRTIMGLALLLALAGCSKDDDGPGTAPVTTTGTLRGMVTIAGPGTPLSGVAVTSSAGGSATTDLAGRFNLIIPANQDVRLDVTKAGFTLNQQILHLTPNDTGSVTVGLLPAGATQSVMVATGGTVIDPSSSATIALPANFVTASGAVSTTITGLDPTGSQVQALPGGLEAVDGSGATKYLMPVSFAEYTVKDAAGKVLQFNPAATQGVAIELPIPASLVGKPGYANGDPIECYRYDPADGKWKTPVTGVVGPSSANGQPAVKATVFHLSWYGAALAGTDVACASGVVSDGKGHPVAGARVEAFPGGSTTTNAQGQYQVQAPVNSSAHLVASKAGQGAALLVAAADVETGGGGAACATADLQLAEDTGDYTVISVMGMGVDPSGNPTQYVYVDLVTGRGTELETPIDGAVVQLTDGVTTWTVPGIGAGIYIAETESSIDPPFDLVQGKSYTLKIDYDGDDGVDASGAVRFAGTPTVTNPSPDENVPATFTAAWDDNAAGVSGYSVSYIVVNGNLVNLGLANVYITSSRSFVIGSNVTDPVTENANLPLEPGEYSMRIVSGTGPFAQDFGTPGVPYTPNISGPATTGFFFSYIFTKPVIYSSGIPVTAHHVVRAVRPLALETPGFRLRVPPATIDAALARARAQRAGVAMRGRR